MKTVIIYNSQTGFTKRYAEWIAETAGADCLELQKAKKTDLSVYEAIVFGSWVCSEGISKLSWFQSNVDKWSNKKLIVFCVGGSPLNSPRIDSMMKKNFIESERHKVNVFYCPGGFNYEKMSAPSRIMMGVFLQALKVKKDLTPEDKELLKMITSSYDMSDKKYIEPILRCLES